MGPSSQRSRVSIFDVSKHGDLISGSIAACPKSCEHIMEPSVCHEPCQNMISGAS